MFLLYSLNSIGLRPMGGGGQHNRRVGGCLVYESSWGGGGGFQNFRERAWLCQVLVYTLRCQVRWEGGGSQQKSWENTFIVKLPTNWMNLSIKTLELFTLLTHTIVKGLSSDKPVDSCQEKEEKIDTWKSTKLCSTVSKECVKWSKKKNGHKNQRKSSHCTSSNQTGNYIWKFIKTLSSPVKL